MNENYIPEGYYVVEDADGERLVRKPKAQQEEAMKTPEEWAREIIKRANSVTLPNPLSPFGQIIRHAGVSEAIVEAVREIQAEAQQSALALQPPLGELLVDDERAAKIRDGLGEPHGSVFTVIAPEDAYDLLADRQTLLRMLNDPAQDPSVPSEFYRSGWNAMVTYGPWTTLEALREGAIFETLDGIRAVKSEYSSATDKCQVVYLEDGLTSSIQRQDQEAVREILIGWEEAK